MAIEYRGYSEKDDTRTLELVFQFQAPDNKSCRFTAADIDMQLIYEYQRDSHLGLTKSSASSAQISHVSIDKQSNTAPLASALLEGSSQNIAWSFSETPEDQSGLSSEYNASIVISKAVDLKAIKIAQITLSGT